MNFASYEFWKLLILCFIGSRLILAIVRSASPFYETYAAKLCLLATALTLLAAESWLTLSAFLWVVLLGWLCVLLQQLKWKKRPKSVVFFLLLIAQITPLFYYKYWNFFLNECLGLDVRIPSVLIPMGLSFYTFQTIGFWLDNLRTPQNRPTFLDYLNFSSFFPQIVAGPIEKGESLLSQIETIQFRLHRENLQAALRWIILGLAYKLIVADNIGLYAGKLSVIAANPFHVWFETLSFSMRIYFDFAGYSFIAVGLGLLFGVQLTLNFRCPYCSSDLREFWRNWHVTLGAWLRDYIYLPLGGRRSPRWMLNIMVVFLVSGIWHGAGWGFIIWGALHGIGVAFCGYGKPLTRLGPLRWAATFIYVVAAWLFFFERDSKILMVKALAIFNPLQYDLQAAKQLTSIFRSPSDAITLGTILLISFTLLLLEWWGLRRNTEPYHILRHPIASAILLFFTILLAPMEESQFIYFNF
jgi:D-alanyl-lipoteichoic acid acyltransferase DltB (MBOAT superfamily)